MAEPVEVQATEPASPFGIDPFLRFPPFPQPPSGVFIIPFKDFRPKGIAIKLDGGEENEIELDGEGIPTVALAKKHDLPGEGSKRRKRRKRTAVGADGVVRTLLWYEDWEEGEAGRLAGPIDHGLAPVDRFHQAAFDFRNNRPWPPTNHTLQQLWDYFRLYVGLITNIQPPPSKKGVAQAEQAHDGIENELDDDDVDMAPDANGIIVSTNDAVASKLRAENGRARDAEKPADPDDLEELRRIESEARMEGFLDDPDNAIRVFFSSHFRDKGLMWEKTRCRDGPILIKFFLEFLLRSRVLPESEKQLQKALATVKIAVDELPLTFIVGGVLPDRLSERFLHLFGSMAQRSIWTSQDKEAYEQFKEAQARAEEEFKQREAEIKEENKREFADFVASNTSADVQAQAIDPDDPSFNHEQEAQKDAIKDNVDQNGREVDPDSGWGGAAAAQDKSWGDPSASNNGWGDPDINDAWDGKRLSPSLIELLGPTVLPHTHTTGIIETSTRMILKVVPPPPTGQPRKKPKKGRPAAEAVEEDLADRFGYMVLSPWKQFGNHGMSDIVPPQILPDSRGAVVQVGTEGGESKPATALDSVALPFDPMKDNIHVLLTTEAAEQVTRGVGMGLYGTWVQLTRRDHAAEPEDEDIKGWEKQDLFEADRKYGATGVNGMPTKWWYMDQHVATFVSFHTDKSSDEDDNMES